MKACETLVQKIAANRAKPCAKPFRPVFPDSVAGYVAPGILWLGMTIIGYGLSTKKNWALSGLMSANTQMSIMMLLMVADHGSSYWDHSRVSDAEYCLTSMLTSKKLDGTTGRVVFGGLGALLAAASAYGMHSGSITLAATSVPFATIMFYLCWSPQTFQSCKANGLVTGALAFGLDAMTFVGIMEALMAASGNGDTSWHRPTLMYTIVISLSFFVLFGWQSEYGKRIKDGGTCAIDDEADAAAEKGKDRRPELYTGILMSVVSIVYFLYLKASFSEISCCSVYPALVFLGFDVLTKLQVWKRGEPLVGDALHRSFIYVTVQVLDVLLSSGSLIAAMSERGLVPRASASASASRGLLGTAAHMAGGSLTYVWSIARLVGAIVSGRGATGTAAAGSLNRLAEIVKLVTLNVAANAVPLYIDQKNAAYMLSFSPQNDLNVPCHVD